MAVPNRLFKAVAVPVKRVRAGEPETACQLTPLNVLGRLSSVKGATKSISSVPVPWKALAPKVRDKPAPGVRPSEAGKLITAPLLLTVVTLCTAPSWTWVDAR